MSKEIFDFEDAVLNKKVLDDMWYEEAHRGLDCLASWYGGDVYAYVAALYNNNGPQEPEKEGQQ